MQFNGAVSGVTVDYQVKNSAGSSVFSQKWTGQSFVGGTPRSFSASWRVPGTQPSGSYVFQIYVTDAAALKSYGSMLNAGTFTVT